MDEFAIQLKCSPKSPPIFLAIPFSLLLLNTSFFSPDGLQALLVDNNIINVTTHMQQAPICSVLPLHRRDIAVKYNVDQLDVDTTDECESKTQQELWKLCPKCPIICAHRRFIVLVIKNNKMKILTRRSYRRRRRVVVVVVVIVYFYCVVLY